MDLLDSTTMTDSLKPSMLKWMKSADWMKQKAWTIKREHKFCRNEAIENILCADQHNFFKPATKRFFMETSDTSISPINALILMNIATRLWIYRAFALHKCDVAFHTKRVTGEFLLFPSLSLSLDPSMCHRQQLQFRSMSFSLIHLIRVHFSNVRPYGHLIFFLMSKTDTFHC